MQMAWERLSSLGGHSHIDEVERQIFDPASVASPDVEAADSVEAVVHGGSGVGPSGM
ncbi:hypothetical protein [Paraburkholderia domus]|uniref:hypothetical protein n=1 Tax=Paraburkholderia domus TaxID=2793075 RepID=UPI001914774F|nr:hypothetical protein [Paraburkholderia domus]MBK5065883.1 hypothetical protein [Burkholderia sp. R-70199]CAE6959051.1 hypothetical protein R70199_07171 [Paraburkholderia domus]